MDFTKQVNICINNIVVMIQNNNNDYSQGAMVLLGSAEETEKLL